MVKFDDIKVGDEIPADIRRTINQDMIDKFAEVSVDFNPLHVDPEFGKTTPFGTTISHGSLTITFIMQMMAEWLGDGFLRGGQMIGMKFIAPVKSGDTVSPHGKVVDKRVEGDKKLIECDVWLENQDGTQTIVGKAIGQAA